MVKVEDNGGVAECSESSGEITHVIIHPEGLLEQQDAGGRGSGRPRHRRLRRLR